jgi:hypothetical protein
MRPTVEILLKSFDHLATAEKREFLDEIIRRTRDLDRPPLDDEAMDRIADESFTQYDADEAADADR